MRRIVWAIDPFEATQGNIERMKRTLRFLRNQQPFETLPVSIFVTPDRENLPEMLPSAVQDREREATKRALNSVVQELGVPDVHDPQVVNGDASVHYDPARALIRYAHSENADAVLLATKGKHGLARWILGSFAESLVLHADLPILVVGPNAAPPSSATAPRILFSTEASAAAEPIFQSVLTIAKDFGLGLTISHVMRAGIEPAVQSAALLVGGGWLPAATTQEDEGRAERISRAWVAQARAVGVSAELSLNTGGPDLSKAILQEAHALRPAFLAVASYSSAFEAAVLGSVARELMRHAEAPVWVIRAPS